MEAKELTKGMFFRYGRSRKPIEVLKAFPLADRAGVYDGITRIYICTAKGKDIILDANDKVFLFEPYQIKLYHGTK
jgi:hypothetical protein